MKLRSSNIKSVLVSSRKNASLLFPEIEPCTFKSKLKK